jgi:hypothetical protein
MVLRVEYGQELLLVQVHFKGYVGTGGYLLAAQDATVVQVDNDGGAATAYTAGNILANLQDLTAAIPAAVYVKEDLHIYMSPKTFRLYISKVSSIGLHQCLLNEQRL